MVLWAILILITLISCAALVLTMKATVQPSTDVGENFDATRDHQRRLLAEIDEDFAMGRISEHDANVAKSELAREVIKAEKEKSVLGKSASALTKWVIPAATICVALVSFGIYSVLGNPDLPANPLAKRQLIESTDVNVDAAIAQVEERLQEHPDDLRGWMVLAPIYMRAERFDDAVIAFRKILELSPITADNEVNLAEALMLAGGGIATGEPLALLQSAADRDPEHVRSRFYLAGEATQQQQYEKAETLWKELLLLSNGDEPWVVTARQGLKVAQDALGVSGAEGGLSVENKVVVIGPDHDQREMIEGMVSGLSDRLYSDGGTIDEWTRLVRSRLVLDQVTDAQQAYDAAKSAFPDATDRVEIDALATQNGLR